jgi:rRNA-processing protein FCF1
MAADRRRHTEGLGLDIIPITVLLDSNFLFVPFRFGVDIFEEMERLFSSNVRCLVSRLVLDELVSLKRGAKPGFLREINFAVKMAERCEIFEDMLRLGETVDQSLVRVAREKGFYVATNDAELRKALRNEGVSVVFLRQKTYLEVDGVIR